MSRLLSVCVAKMVAFSPEELAVDEPNRIDREKLQGRLVRAFDFAATQVRATIERDPDFFPIYTTGGRWKHSGESWTEWCAGFHTGMMWLIAEGPADPWGGGTAG